MRIGLLNTEVVQGGAARAMQRTLKALRDLGHDTVLMTLSGDAGPKEGGPVLQIADGSPPDLSQRASASHGLFNGWYVDRNRTEGSNTLFWLPAVGFDLSQALATLKLDVLNVHWTSYFVNLGALEQLLSIEAPTIFTLHDMAHFTGGCHYSAGCQRFQTDCAGCPQLKRDPLGLPSEVRAARARLYAQARPWAVAPSHWLTDQARASGLFDPAHCLRIANALDSSVFAPHDRRQARAALGIPAEAQVIMFGAFDNREARKGFDLLVPAVADMLERRSGLAGPPLVVVGFGRHLPDLGLAGVQVIGTGYIDDDHRLAQAYSACDVVALPSREDNQPNVMVEAMACGTPVAGFRIGGLPDLITHGVTGALAEPFSVTGLAAALETVLEAGAKGPAMRQAARRAVMDATDPHGHARAYLDLFEMALAERGLAARRGRRTPLAPRERLEAPSNVWPLGGPMGAVATGLVEWKRRVRL